MVTNAKTFIKENAAKKANKGTTKGKKGNGGKECQNENITQANKT